MHQASQKHASLLHDDDAQQVDNLDEWNRSSVREITKKVVFGTVAILEKCRFTQTLKNCPTSEQLQTSQTNVHSITFVLLKHVDTE